MVDIGTAFTITDKTLNRLTQEQIDRLLKTAGAALVNKMFVDGAERVSKVDEERIRDDLLNASTIRILAEEDFSEPSLRFLLARAIQKNHELTAAIFAVDDMPLWKIVWYKLRGKLLVRVEA